MTFLCKEIGTLPQNYTNHCLRSTGITVLDNAGFEARHITAVSGHKNESTIRTYSVKCPPQKKREMYESLQQATAPKKSRIQPAETVSRNPEPVVCEQPTSYLQLLNHPMENDDQFLMKYLDETFPANNNTPTVNNVPISEQAATPVPPPMLQQQDMMNFPPIPEQNFNNMPPPQSNYQVSNLQFGNPQIPVTPKMWFPGSNVTINYNFGSC